MKIAIVSPYPPSKGTLNEYAYHLVQNFKKKPEISKIIILTDIIDEAYPTLDSYEDRKIKIVPCWKFNDPLACFKIASAAKSHKADTVLYNIQFLSFGDNKFYGALGLLSPAISRMRGIPSVTLLHNITETVDYESAGITSSKLMSYIYNGIGTVLTKLLLKSHMMTVTMPKYVRILEKKYKVDNVALIPHGSFEVPKLPEEKKDTPLRVMTFGKFGTYKKVEEMIEAVEIVRNNTGKEIEIVIAGTDNPNVKGYLEGVRSKYSDIKNITYTGYVEEEDVPRIFCESTVVVFPYTSTTGSSGVLHQAGSYARAVVLPNIGDLKELIEEEGYKGEYFMPEDIEGLATAIQKLIENPEYRKEMGETNYAAACSLPMTDITQWYLLHFQKLIKYKHHGRKQEMQTNVSMATQL